ncbi:hypothetical protein AB0F11_03975 [Streptomyces sp. NPDC032472]|uniref:D-alanyl-D-alanine carboxypeptidase n=1 Tax=Streptomyces sp. NPDC032472 TaxID=3155018 RepID=UPI0033D5B9E6
MDSEPGSAPARAAVFREPKFDSDPEDDKAAVGSDPADSERTAVFRAPKFDSASASASAAAKSTADPERTAVFRAPRIDAPSAVSRDTKPAEADSDDSGRPAAGEDKPSASASADKAAERSADVDSADSGRGSLFQPKQTSASASAAEPSGDVESAGSERGSLFQPKKASASASAPAKPAGDGDAADSERTAVFRAVKPGATGTDKPSASASGPGGATGRSGGDVKSADSGRAADPRSAAGTDKAAGGAAGSGSASVFQPKKPSGPAKPAADGDADDSERTAVFRAPKPGAVKPAAGRSGGDVESADSGRAADPRSAAGTDKAAGGAAGSGSASVFQPKKPSGPAKPAADGDADDSERTAVFRAPKPGAAAGADKAAAGPAGDGKGGKAAGGDKPVASRPVPPKSVGGEKASTFVPLRADGGPAKPAAGAARPATATAPKPAPSAGLDPSERTTQQPLPPKPPLDMLADLTNNPPPPPTPMRTVVRRFKIYAPLVVLLLIILAVVQLVRPLPEPTLKMTAKSTYTFDGAAPTLPWPKEGQAYMAASGLGTVGTFGEQKPIAIGSVAKTMTAYVILKNHPMKKGEKGPMIDIDKAAVDDGKKDSEGESTVNTLKEGDKITEYDALAAIMIPSANNVARLLARWDTGGDQEAFVKKMNDTAKELGMTNTTYTDPSGLDATTVSTAEDQVKLGLKVVEMPELIAITKLVSWVDPYGRSWPNWNHLIPGNGALGIKTGSTTKAGGNLLFAAEKKVGKTNQLIVGAVLGQHGTPILDTAIAASKALMLATQKSLVNATVVKKGDTVGYVDDGLGGHTPVVATADVEAVGWPSLSVALKLGNGEAKLPQTAKAGTEVGVLTVGEGASQVKVPVALKSDLAAPGLGAKLTRVG